jgi:uncharacterized membrane protein
MAKTVIGVFRNRSDADRAVEELRQKGFGRDISIIARGEGERAGEGTVAEGVVTGGTLGGLAGLLAGAGALAIPGVGPILAAGPIAGALTGAATGGLAGGLIDWGIPEERGRFYEQKVREGNLVAMVKSSDQKVNEAADIMRRHGAQDVETHTARG